MLLLFRWWSSAATSAYPMKGPYILHPFLTGVIVCPINPSSWLPLLSFLQTEESHHIKSRGLSGFIQLLMIFLDVANNQTLMGVVFSSFLLKRNPTHILNFWPVKLLIPIKRVRFTSVLPVSLLSLGKRHDKKLDHDAKIMSKNHWKWTDMTLQETDKR